jgi:AraC family transcriptional regulator
MFRSNRLLISSEGLGWRNLYVSLAMEQSWSATLPAVEHHCLAYCLDRPAAISRRLDGGRTSESAVLQPRHFGTIPPRIESQWEVKGSPQIMLLYLRRSMIDRVIDEVFEKDSRHVDVMPILGTADPLLEQLARSILDTVRRKDETPNRLYVESLAQTMAVQLLHAYGAGLDPGAAGRAAEADISAPGMRRVLDYIESALDEDLSLESLAQQANYSQHFFARAFRKQMGEAPHQYVLRRRIERAKQLLSQTDLPLVHIALSTGFSSQSHLSSTFKRLTGVTPGEYRRS